MLSEQDQVYAYFHENAKELADRYLPRDRQDKGWVCPLCSNGTGKDGDGLRYEISYEKPGKFHCFKCGFDGDLIDLVGEQYGIDPKHHREKREKACEVFGLGLGELKSFENRPKPVIKKEPEKSRKEEILEILEESLSGNPGKFSRLFEEAHKDLNKAEVQRYIKSRGITEGNPFLKSMGFLQDKFVGDRKFRSCVAFFGTSSSFAVRDLDGNVEKSKRVRKPSGAFDIPVGLLEVIKQKNKVVEETGQLEPVFIVEGLFDAPSIAEAGADAVSLNGTSNIRPVIWAFEKFGIKRPLILVFDNDPGGDKALDHAVEDLKRTDLEFNVVRLCPKGCDPNDCLLVDRETFVKQINYLRRHPDMKFTDGLNRFKRFELARQLSESTKDSGIRTGFDTLDNEEFLDGGLYPGLYIIGAMSSLGKTTFILQMADQIAASGQDVIFFSLEMPQSEIMIKSVSRYTLTDLFKSGLAHPGERVDSRAKSYLDIYRGYAEDDSGVMKKALNAYFDDTGDHLRIIEGMGDVDADTVRTIIENHIKETGRVPVVFIDYLQLLIQPKDENGNRPNRSDKQITDANIFKLKRISRDCNATIFGVSSFNRDNYNEPVSMKSYKESGAIEYSSDVLIGLEPEFMGVEASFRDSKKLDYKSREFEKGIRSIRLVLLKNRKGKAGGVDLFDYYPKYNCYVEKGDADFASSTF